MQISETKRNMKYTLWFDVEKRYKTISVFFGNDTGKLWFDVEKRYKTIIRRKTMVELSCGLM